MTLVCPPRDPVGLPDDAPELAALGFFSVGPRFRNDRLERAADQIAVVTRGVIGLSVACARCHDHRCDPIPIEDYYSLYGVMQDYRRQLSVDATDTLTRNCRPYFLGYHDMHVGGQIQIRAVVSKRKVEHSAMTPLAAELLQLTQR